MERALNVECFTGGLLATNGYFVAPEAGGTAGVLVDAPKGIGAWAEAAGWTIEALLLTHQHFDHIEDVADVVRRWGCKVYAWSNYDRGLTLEDFFGGFAGISLELEPFGVDELLEGRGRLEVGGLSWELLHVPGHSPDSVCFYQREGGELFDGDVLMAGGIGRSDFPGGDGALLVRGIREQILPLDGGVRVWPGHGPGTTVGDERAGNPFL